jgi:hypothetical protein
MVCENFLVIRAQVSAVSNAVKELFAEKYHEAGEPSAKVIIDSPGWHFNDSRFVNRVEFGDSAEECQQSGTYSTAWRADNKLTRSVEMSFSMRFCASGTAYWLAVNPRINNSADPIVGIYADVKSEFGKRLAYMDDHAGYRGGCSGDKSLFDQAFKALSPPDGSLPESK